MTIWLIDRLGEFGDREAVVSSDGQSTSFSNIVASVQEWKKRFSEASLESSSVVALVGDFTSEVISAFLALIDCDCIIVPLTLQSYLKNPNFLDIAEVQYVIKCGSTPSIEKRDVSPTNELTLSLVSEVKAGLVLFSSGSTGKSKAALHSIGPLLEKYKARRSAARTLTFLLLDHIGGVNTLFHTLANGGVIATARDRTPASVFESVQKARVEILPVSPTFLNLCLLSGDYRNFDLTSLRKITYGTEPMPQSTLDRLVKLFPDVELQQTYGLSELGILRSKSQDRGSLWVKIGGEGFETKVVDGKLWVRAASAMLGYLNAPSPFDDEGWFNTHDMVEVDGDYFRILGRDSEIINVGGEKVYPAEVESHILKVDNVKDVVVYGISNPLSGQIVAASVNLREPESARAIKKRVRDALWGKVESFKIPQKVVVTNETQFNDRFKHMRAQASQGD